MKKFVVSFILIFCMLGLVLSGCGSGNSNSTPKKAVPKNGKNIVVAVNADFVSLDPQDTNDNLSYGVEKTVYEGLLGFDKNMKVVPALATSYKASKDAKTFTFKLRKGVKFQDGTPFNAEAVKFNFDRVSDPKSVLKRHSLYAVIKKTTVVDDYTVKFTLSQPFGAMINTFAHPAGMIVSPAAVKKYGKDFMKHPVGTGPYKFKSWTQDGNVKVVKNTDYWKKGGPKLDSITFKPVPEDGSRVAMLKTGEADMITPMPTVQAKGLKGKTGLDVISEASIGVRYMSMNTLIKPFDNAKVRQALNYAVDKKAFDAIVYSGYAQPATSSMGHNVQFYSKQPAYDYDVAKAKQLLKEAGYAKGFSATIWAGNDSQSTKAMEFLQQQLSKVNVKLKVVPMESGTMASKIWGVDPKESDMQLYYGGWTPSTGDADWAVRPLLGGSSLPPVAYNTAFYKNAEVDGYLNQGLQTADPAARKEAYAKMQTKIWQDAPWVFLATPDNVYGVRNYLKGAYVQPDSIINVAQAEINK